MFYLHCGAATYFVGWVDEVGRLWCANMTLRPFGATIEGEYCPKGIKPLTDLKTAVLTKYSVKPEQLISVDLNNKELNYFPAYFVGAAEGDTCTPEEHGKMELHILGEQAL